MPLVSRRSAFLLLTIAFTLGAIIFLDFIYGALTRTGTIRDAALKFRSEAGPLAITTKKLIPEIVHTFEGVLRPEGEKYLPIEAPRIFRTNEYGAITASSGNGSAGRNTTLLFLGGSTTEANEVDEPFRFPALAKEILSNTYGVEVTTWNSGIRGHTTLDSINLLLNHTAFRDADYVIMMHNINDRLRLAVQGSYAAPGRSTSPVSWERITASGSALAAAMWDYFSYRSNILFAMRTEVGDFNPFAGERNNPIVSEDVIDFEGVNLEQSQSRFRANLRAFTMLARSLQQTPVLMTQPLGRQSIAQDQFNEIIREVSAKQKVILIDIDKKFPLDRGWLFFSDNIHLNNEGSIAVAHIIAQELSGILGSIVPKHHYELSLPLNLDKLANRCLPPPDTDQMFTSGPRHLLIGRQGRYPSFTADGKKLVFQSLRNDREYVLYYDFITQRYVRVSDREADYTDRHPVVLDEKPDGSFTLAIGSDRSGKEQVYVMEWPSRKVSPLIPGSELGGAIPARGPGSRVLFAGFGGKWNGIHLRTPELFAYDRETAELIRLTETEFEEWRPAVGPEGRYVYYIDDSSGNFDVFRMLINDQKRELIYTSDADEWDPAVSPDGRWLAFASKQMGNWDLFLLDLHHPQTVVRVTAGPEDDWDPSFYLDHRLLAFASSRGEVPRIFILCTFGQHPA